MFLGLGKIVARHWPWVLLAWALTAVGLHLVAPQWNRITYDGDFEYLPARMTSVRGERLLQEAFPRAHSRSQMVLVVARPEGKLTGADYDVADRLVAQYSALAEDESSPVLAVWSYESDVIGGKLISRPGAAGQAVLILLKLRSELMAIGNMPLLADIERTFDALRREPAFPAGLQMGVTGSAAIGADMLFAAEQSIRNTEIMTLVLVTVILLLVYRAPGLLVVPLLTILVSVFVATDVVALLARASQYSGWFDFRVFKTTRIFVIVILYGAGTDFCLFLIARYREELTRGVAPPQALASALGHVGSALAASALTTIVGLAMMVFAEFGKFRNGGPAIALSLSVTLLACVTLAPALLRAMGLMVFWPWGRALRGAVAASGDAEPSGRMTDLWRAMSHVVLTRGGTTLLIALAITAVPAAFGLAVPITYNLLNELQDDRPSVQGTRLLRQYFLPGEIGPATLVVRQPGVDFLSVPGQQQIARLTRTLYELHETDAGGESVRPIVSVRSLTEPLGDPPGTRNPLSSAGLRKLIVLKNPKTLEAYVSHAPGLAGEVTRFDLIFRYDPFARESVALLDELERRMQAIVDDPASEWHGAQFAFSGATAGIRDLQIINRSDRWRIQALVVVAVLLVLVLILGHPWICAYLVLSVLWGYLVTMGITRGFFAWLYPHSFEGLDWKVPIFLFVILVAVGADYNIYLVTRTLEEQRRRGRLAGLRAGMLHTGGIITSCGVIMAGTFAAMAAGSLRAMQELGFALALGVIFDTFVIRTLLVPAMLALSTRLIERQGKPQPALPAARNGPD